MSQNQPSRRTFVKTSALAGAGAIIASQAAFGDENKTGDKKPDAAAAEVKETKKLNLASIGVGGKGGGDCDQAANLCNVVALCDIDDNNLKSKAQRFPNAKTYNDYRKMFEEMGDKIDCVTISTPDHHHAPAAMLALNRGIHVYCQKPMTHSVAEARLLRETAKAKGVATQMGNQGTADDQLRRGVEVIRAGAIGPVTEVHVWTNRPVWPQSPGLTKRLEEQPVPEHIHWDEWVGPAPERPYNKGYHPFNWRGFWDFGTGALGDMGCHTANLPFMALKLGYPKTIHGESEAVNSETFPGWARVTYEFPERDGMPALKFIWYEGRKDGKLVHPPEELQAKVLGPTPEGKDGKPGKPPKLNDSGCIMVGEKGLLYSPHDYGGGWKLYPEEDFKDYKDPEKTLPRNGKGDDGMKIEWIAAANGGPPAMSNFEYAGMLTEFILLGNIAILNPGKTLEWDGPNMKFTNAPEAEKFLKRDYREGWKV